MEWQPIETAPSQTSVLVGNCSLKGFFRVAIRDAFGDWHNDGLGYISMDPLDKSPTHWMPLPLPPGAS